MESDGIKQGASRAQRSADLDEGHEGRHGGVRGLAVGGVFIERQMAHNTRRVVLRLVQVTRPATGPLLWYACVG